MYHKIKSISFSMAPLLTMIMLAPVGCTPPDGNQSVPQTVPEFDAARFSNAAVVDNPLFPLVVGATLTYGSQTANGLERVVSEVLDETRSVEGVPCRVVRVREYVDDVLVEDTRDWYAQDDEGNVWYMGEDVDNYNYDDAGAFIDITHEGAWEAGKDVAGLGTIARPGYIMRAAPTAGDAYHQEYYVGDAEDEAVVVATNVALTLSNGMSYNCLQTREFTRLEPDLNEYKYYAPGVGLVKEEHVGGSEMIELVSVEP